MRSKTAHVDDTLRVTVGEASEVWVYRADRLVLRCRPKEASEHCTPDAHGMIVKTVLSMPVTYHVIVIEAPAAPPPIGLDAARAAVVVSGAQRAEFVVPVH